MGEAAIAWGFFAVYLLVVGGAATIGIQKVTGFASFSVGTPGGSPVPAGLSLAANLTSAATFIISSRLIYL